MIVWVLWLLLAALLPLPLVPDVARLISTAPSVVLLLLHLPLATVLLVLAASPAGCRCLILLARGFTQLRGGLGLALAAAIAAKSTAQAASTVAWRGGTEGRKPSKSSIVP
jgi:hypothetical protein